MAIGANTIEVRAIDNEGLESETHKVTVFVVIDPPEIPKRPDIARLDGNLVIGWEPVIEADSYEIYRCEDGQSGDECNNKVERIEGISFVDDTVKPEAIYRYSVKACLDETCSNKSPVKVADLSLSDNIQERLAEAELAHSLVLRDLDRAKAGLFVADQALQLMMQSGSDIEVTKAEADRDLANSVVIALTNRSNDIQSMVEQIKATEQNDSEDGSSVPDAPVLLHQELVDFNLTISWGGVILANRYEVYKCQSASTQGCDIIEGTDNEFVTIKNLERSSKNYYRLKACNDEGCSTAFSDEILVVVPSGAPTLTVTSLGANNVTISSMVALAAGVTPYQREVEDNSQEILLFAPLAANEAKFAGWVGCDSQTGRICTLSVDSDRDVRAVYRATLAERIPARKTVTESGLPTSAKIRGVIDLKNGGGNVSSVTAPAHVKLEIAVEPEVQHVGVAGYIYLFANINGFAHYVDSLGRILPYESVEQVKHFFEVDSFDATNIVTVFDGILAESDKGFLELVVAYSLKNNPVDLYKNSEYIVNDQ